MPGNDEKEPHCALTGNLRYREEFPAVGDDVEISENPCGDSLIQAIQPRRTVFCLPDRGGHADSFTKMLQMQPPIADIDMFFISTSLNPDLQAIPVSSRTDLDWTSFICISDREQPSSCQALAVRASLPR